MGCTWMADVDSFMIAAGKNLSECSSCQLKVPLGLVYCVLFISERGTLPCIGQLTKAKSWMVCNQNLSEAGLRHLHLQRYMTLPPAAFDWTAGCELPVRLSRIPSHTPSKRW